MMNYDFTPLVVFMPLILIVALWDVAWKGLALWRAARNGHTGWFVALIIINSAGILPIIYLLLNPVPTKAPKK